MFSTIYAENFKVLSLMVLFMAFELKNPSVHACEEIRGLFIFHMLVMIMIMNYHHELVSKMNSHSELSFVVFSKIIVHINSSFCFFTKTIVQYDSSFQDELSHELSCDNELFVA